MKLRILLAIIFSLIITSANSKTQKEKIQEIRFSTTEGWLIKLGFNLKFTPDSVNYYLTVENRPGRYDTIMSSELWNKLLNTIDLATFETIKSEPSRKDNDGSDSEIHIVTNKKEISIMNWSDSDYKLIKEFSEMIDILELEYRQKVLKVNNL